MSKFNIAITSQIFVHHAYSDICAPSLTTKTRQITCRVGLVQHGPKEQWSDYKVSQNLCESMAPLNYVRCIALCDKLATVHAWMQKHIGNTGLAHKAW